MKYIKKGEDPEEFRNWKLRAMRRAAIDGVLLAIDGLSTEEIQQLLQGYQQLDVNGQYTPFCAAITYIIEQYFVV